MTEKDIKELFELLNIRIEPLHVNYDPDNYARKLKNYTKTDEISYAVNTTLEPSINK